MVHFLYKTIKHWPRFGIMKSMATVRSKMAQNKAGFSSPEPLKGSYTDDCRTGPMFQMAQLFHDKCMYLTTFFFLVIIVCSTKETDIG